MPAILPLDAFDLAEEAVRERFDRAVRQGHPHWLWPGTSVAAWQTALMQFERVARQVLTEGQACEPLHGRAEDVGVAAYTSGMGPLLGAWLREGLIAAPPRIAAMLDLHHRHNRLRMERMARRATAVVDALARAGVEVVVLKGMDTAWSLFPDPATRPLSDIDLLVDPAAELAADAVLREMGFVAGAVGRYPPARNWRSADAPVLPRTLTFVHHDDPWSVDLQTSLNRRYSFGAPVIMLDRIRSSATLEPWGLSPGGSTLAGEARAIHLAVHASCGLQSLSLLRLVELIVAIRSAARFGWGRFAELAERAGALAMTYPALHLAEQLAPGTVPAEVLARCERAVPRRVRSVIARLAPHSAQRVLRCSLEERFMWSPSPWRRLIQIVRELHPPGLPVAALPSIYRARAWRLLHGTLTR
jgi:hypothetical protein